jgi:predicted dehydrogenase/threonine dehydrogenase-like Zn-dependent dehydrogenase
VKQLVQSMRTGAVNVVDVPPPRLAGPGVLVQTAVSLISAGTERAALEFAKSSLVEKARSRPDLVQQVLDKVRRDGLMRTMTVALARLDRPVAPGYATAGTVIAVAPGVDDVGIGDRVACAGATYATHAEINYIPRNLVVPVPRRHTGDSVGFDEASFTTVGAIALHGVRLGAPEIGHRVVVIGLGVIGLLATQILRAHGCRVFGIDLQPSRCDLARALGADEAMGPLGAGPTVARWSGGLGADLVIVAAATKGSDPAVLAAEIARNKGRIVAIGATGLDLPRRTLYQKELSLVVSRSYGPGRYDPDYEERGHDYPRAYVRWTERENMRTFLDLVAEGRVDVRPLISHRYDIGRGAEAYDALEQSDALGVLIDYGTAPAAAAAESIVVSSRPRLDTQGRPQVSVIGAGTFAHDVLLPSLKRAGVARRAIVATTGLSARSAADKFGFESCATAVDTIWHDSDCDAVVIATRHDSHAQLTIDALEAGKAVFVEKPLCITEDELDRIAHVVDTLRAAGQAPFVMVGFNRRFAPAVEAVRAAMAGAPVSIVYRVNAGRLPSQSWISHAEEGGGRIVGEVCHFVDLCAHLAGSPVAEVCATRSAAGPDDVMVSVRMVNGSLASVAYLIDGDRAASKERIEVFGGGRTATIDDFRRARVSGAGRAVRHGGVLARQDKGHTAEMAAFVSAVAAGRVSPVSFESALNTTRATFAIVRSLECGGPVRVP